MCQTKYSKKSYKLMKAFQQDELNSAAIYAHFAHCDKDKKNCQILQQIANDEAHHATVWKKYTNKHMKPNMFKVWWFRILTYLLGYTFVIKLFEKDEYSGISSMEELKDVFPVIGEKRKSP